MIFAAEVTPVTSVVLTIALGGVPESWMPTAIMVTTTAATILIKANRVRLGYMAREKEGTYKQVKARTPSAAF